MTIAFVIFGILAIFTLIIAMIAPKGADGASQVFGYELRIVTSDSMDKCAQTDVSAYEIGSIKKNTMIAIEHVPSREAEAYDWYSNVKVGDVLTIRYAYDRQVTITHRVTAINPNLDGDGYIIELAGDNKNSDSTQLFQTIDTSELESHNYVIGKVVWTSYVFGVIIGGFQRVTKALVSD